MNERRDWQLRVAQLYLARLIWQQAPREMRATVRAISDEGRIIRAARESEADRMFRAAIGWPRRAT